MFWDWSSGFIWNGGSLWNSSSWLCTYDTVLPLLLLTGVLVWDFVVNRWFPSIRHVTLSERSQAYIAQQRTFQSEFLRVLWWMLDTGTSVNLTGNVEWLSDVSYAAKDQIIVSGVTPGTTVRSVAVGTVITKFKHADGICRPGRISEVYYIPGLKVNLLNDAPILDRGFRINLEKGNSFVEVGKLPRIPLIRQDGNHFWIWLLRQWVITVNLNMRTNMVRFNGRYLFNLYMNIWVMLLWRSVLGWLKLFLD